MQIIEKLQVFLYVERHKDRFTKMFKILKIILKMLKIIRIKYQFFREKLLQQSFCMMNIITFQRNHISGYTDFVLFINFEI